MEQFYRFVEETFSCELPVRPGYEDLDKFPYPAFDLYEKRHFVPPPHLVRVHLPVHLLRAPYLYPRFVHRQAKGVLREIMHWRSLGVSHFALYGDNFLVRREAFAKPLLRGIAELPFDLSP